MLLPHCIQVTLITVLFYCICLCTTHTFFPKINMKIGVSVSCADLCTSLPQLWLSIANSCTSTEIWLAQLATSIHTTSINLSHAVLAYVGTFCGSSITCFHMHSVFIVTMICVCSWAWVATEHCVVIWYSNELWKGFAFVHRGHYRCVLQIAAKFMSDICYLSCCSLFQLI
jgi:hypothetical protein